MKWAYSHLISCGLPNLIEAATNIRSTGVRKGGGGRRLSIEIDRVSDRIIKGLVSLHES